MANQQQERQQGQGQQQGQTRADFTDPELVSPPCQAIWNGRSVKINAAGNLEGHSPAYRMIDEEGQTLFASVSEVTVFDTLYLPVTTEQLQRIAQQALNSQQDNRSRYQR